MNDDRRPDDRRPDDRRPDDHRPDDHRPDDHRPGAEAPADRPGTPPARARPRRWLLAVPLLLLAWPPLYDRAEPAILGIPFYYAYQLGVIPLAAGCTWLVLRSDRRR